MSSYQVWKVCLNSRKIGKSVTLNGTSKIQLIEFEWCTDLDIDGDALVRSDDGVAEETNAEKGRRIEEETCAAKKAKSQKKKVRESQVDSKILEIVWFSLLIISATTIWKFNEGEEINEGWRAPYEKRRNKFICRTKLTGSWTKSHQRSLIKARFGRQDCSSRWTLSV